MENAARKRQVFLRTDEQQVFNQLAVVPAVYGARGENLRGFQKQHGAVFCGGLERAAVNALKASGKFIPWQVKVIATDGSLVE